MSHDLEASKKTQKPQKSKYQHLLCPLWHGVCSTSSIEPRKKPSYFPWNTGWLIGILIMVYHNPRCLMYGSIFTLHVPYIEKPNVGKYTSPMDPMGNSLSYSPYNWVGVHPLYTLNNQGFFLTLIARSVFFLKIQVSMSIELFPNLARMLKKIGPSTTKHKLTDLRNIKFDTCKKYRSTFWKCWKTVI